MNQSLKNVACWGYWNGDLKMYKPGTGRENAPWFEALTGTFCSVSKQTLVTDRQ